MVGSNIPRALRETLTLRRSAFGVSLGLLALILAGGVVGFAAADAERSSAVPSEFGVAKPHEGDFGSYVSYPVKLTEDGLEPTGWSRRHMEFEWMPTTTIRDGQGEGHLVAPLRFIPWSSYENRTVPTVMGQPFIYSQWRYFEVGTLNMVAHGGAGSVQADTAATLLNPSSQTTYGLSAVWHEPFPEREVAAHYVPFCGLLNNLQGTTHELAQRPRLFANCWTQGDYWIMPAARFQALGMESSGDLDALVLQATSAGKVAFAWFAESIPYPVQIAILHTQNETGMAFRLDRFSRGDKPLGGDAVKQSLAPMAPLTWSPRTAYGFDETGIEHPFPLSKAYSFALADSANPGLRNYLASHPDAYMRYADYYEGMQDFYAMKSVYAWTRGWQFVFDDGRSQFAVHVAQDTQTTANGLDRPDSPLLDGITYRYAEAKPALQRNPTLSVNPARVPSFMPTLMSLEHHWQAFADSSESLRGWGFEIGCADAACKDVVMAVKAGSFAFEIADDGIYPVAGEARQSLLYDYVQYDLFSQSAEAPTPIHYRMGHVRASQGSASLGAGEPATGFDSQSTAALPVWRLPGGPYALGATAFAFLVGVLYWIWPAIRHIVGFGLFSRLEKPALLQHPVRQEIVSVVESNPGIHFAEIVRRVGAGNGNTEHHLRHLVAQKVLGEVEAKGYTCYYIPGAVGADAARALPAVKSRGARAILSTIARRPGIRAQEVARAIGMSEPTVHYHLVRLREVGLVDAKRGASGLELRATSTAAIVLPIAA